MKGICCRIQNFRKRWRLFSVLVAVVLFLLFLLQCSRTPMPNAVTISLSGYTNPPGNSIRFALFTVSNQAPYSIRRRNDWVEIEGNLEQQAEIFNLSLPSPGGMNPVLKSGGSFVVAIGEPPELNENGRWRFTISYVPDTFGQKWLAYSFRHDLPVRIGPVALIDSRKLLAPSNNITVASPWLGK